MISKDHTLDDFSLGAVSRVVYKSVERNNRKNKSKIEKILILTIPYYQVWHIVFIVKVFLINVFKLLIK